MAEIALKKKIFTEEELFLLDPTRIPQHIAIIMDGNRRWARMRDLSKNTGHWKGAEVLTHTVRAALELGVKVLTVYGFSTENWSRPSKEVEALMHLIATYLLDQKKSMCEEGIRVSAIGNQSRMPEFVREAFYETKEATRTCEEIELVFALDYGGRDEICRAAKSIFQDIKKGTIFEDQITEQLFSQYLDTKRWMDPDILIRTSGEQRLSNFLLWQIAYTEVIVTDVLWPDFSKKDLLQAVIEYQKRERRLGGS